MTGRKRRCGWFDAALVRQSVATNGITGIALTKLDVLDGLEELKICVGYMLDGEQIDHLPASQERKLGSNRSTSRWRDGKNRPSAPAVGRICRHRRSNMFARSKS